MQRRGACGQHPPWNCIVCVNGEGSPRARPTQVGVLLPCPPAQGMTPPPSSRHEGPPCSRHDVPPPHVMKAHEGPPCLRHEAQRQGGDDGRHARRQLHRQESRVERAHVRRLWSGAGRLAYRTVT